MYGVVGILVRVGEVKLRTKIFSLGEGASWFVRGSKIQKWLRYPSE